MGGHVGLIFDHDGDPGTPGQSAFAVHDAFGNKMSAVGSGPGSYASGTGSFAWRGGEGSVTDREPNLVHMQARHYDPTIGRFLQADSLMLASFTTQGTNRYLYTENDPVNRSDASGNSALESIAGIVSLGLALLLPILGTHSLIAAVLVGGPILLPLLAFFGMFAPAIAALLGGLLLLNAVSEGSRCQVQTVANVAGGLGILGSLAEDVPLIVEGRWRLG